MKNNFLLKDYSILFFVFIMSRLLILLTGLQLDYGLLYSNWQYLDVQTLEGNLLRGVWYDHTQPPLFNLFLGSVLKIFGSNAPIAFAIVLKLFSFINSFLLLKILKRAGVGYKLSLFLSVLYLISPATIVFEHELFYTSFVTLLLLISCYSLIQLNEQISLARAGSFFIPLAMVCLTRSMYHLVWLLIVTGCVLLLLRKRTGFRHLLMISLICIIVTGGWYVKNYRIFGQFSASTWVGMNIARNVFHDVVVTDSSDIASREPFAKISEYRDFLGEMDTTQFKGLNDIDLLREMKNDSFINTKHIGYINVSQQYLAASKAQIRNEPASFIKNVAQSGIIFFTPATVYPTTLKQVEKIRYYDIVYSFNLTHFAHSKQERRIAIVLSAIPKIILYGIIGWLLVSMIRIEKRISVLLAFLLFTFAYIFSVSALFEHYENMRFRYEIEPLFLIAAGLAITFHSKRKKINVNSL